MTDFPTLQPPPLTLLCPKCGGQMRTFERSGIIVDQCVDCRGIFLDRGELERLIDAEELHYRAGPAPLPPDSGYRGRDERGLGWRRDDDDDGDDDGRGGRRRRGRGGFLGDLLDFD